ncbi:hypothetical protein BH09BAC5_BH09BAC5_25230 [soil metagenome]
MIIVSSGFPKSASTLLFLYTEEILKRSGKRSAQLKFRKKYPEGFIHRFGFFNSIYLLLLNVFSGSVVVKTHSGPTFFLRLLIQMKLAKAYYSVRDPRDVILSALDHGEKARENGITSPADNAFVLYHNKEDLYSSLQLHFGRFIAWKKMPDVLLTEYEKLISEPIVELKKILVLLNWQSEEKSLPSIIETFALNRSQTKNFNKGELSRFKNDFSEKEISEIENKIGTVITGMGYSLTGNS